MQSEAEQNILLPGSCPAHKAVHRPGPALAKCQTSSPAPPRLSGGLPRHLASQGNANLASSVRLEAAGVEGDQLVLTPSH